METARAEVDELDEVTQAAGISATAHANISQSPFVSFQMMESLLEKLKLLNYEQFFCQPNRIKGLSRLYFAISTNSSDQFNAFVNLAAWLINQSGINIETPQEFDDPNATVANILDSLRSLAGQAPEFPPSKLKTGSGEYCIHVLDLLADAALRHNRTGFESPQIAEEADEASISSNAAEEATISLSEDGDLVEWTGNKICLSGSTSELRSGILCDSEIDVETGDDGDNDLTTVDISRPGKAETIGKLVYNDDSSPGEESSFIDPHGPFSGLLTCSSAALQALRRHSAPSHISTPNLPLIEMERGDWQMEVERVLPQLHVATRGVETVAKDWRNHLEQISQHRRAIDALFGDSRGHFKRLQEELTRGLNKISSREKYINSQIDQELTEYRCAQDHLSEMKEAYTKASGGIAERTSKLAQLSEEVERVKAEMEQRGCSMTDGSPMIRIKQAIQRLKAENVAMEIRIGVLEHTLLRLQLRAREESQKQLFVRPSHLGVHLTGEGGGTDVV
ncbi:hypothetical protein Aperf_G00000008486 [Anoplocephala perfoliata]